jgi:serine/threonine protein kinase
MAAGLQIKMGSNVVRKRLGEDCLLDGELHPSIAERLARVRELPVASVANLRGVERDEQGAWLVWQYVDGVTLEDFAGRPRSTGELERIIRELNLAVAAMHSHGIVHGAIHARNVIIDPAGHVRLTHVSPLLYADPTDDLLAVETLAGRLGNQKPAPASDQTGSDAADRRFRFRAYVAAVAALVGGLCMFAAILWYIRG